MVAGLARKGTEEGDWRRLSRPVVVASGKTDETPDRGADKIKAAGGKGQMATILAYRAATQAPLVVRMLHETAARLARPGFLPVLHVDAAGRCAGLLPFYDTLLSTGRELGFRAIQTDLAPAALLALQQAGREARQAIGRAGGVARYLRQIGAEGIAQKRPALVAALAEAHELTLLPLERLAAGPVERGANLAQRIREEVAGGRKLIVLTGDLEQAIAAHRNLVETKGAGPAAANALLLGFVDRPSPDLLATPASDRLTIYRLAPVLRSWMPP